MKLNRLILNLSKIWDGLFLTMIHRLEKWSQSCEKISANAARPPSHVCDGLMDCQNGRRALKGNYSTASYIASILKKQIRSISVLWHVRHVDPLSPLSRDSDLINFWVHLTTCSVGSYASLSFCLAGHLRIPSWGAEVIIWILVGCGLTCGCKMIDFWGTTTAFSNTKELLLHSHNKVRVNM